MSSNSLQQFVTSCGKKRARLRDPGRDRPKSLEVGLRGRRLAPLRNSQLPQLQLPFDRAPIRTRLICPAKVRAAQRALRRIGRATYTARRPRSFVRGLPGRVHKRLGRAAARIPYLLRLLIPEGLRSRRRLRVAPQTP